MKLKHFLVLVSLVGIAAIVLLVKACKSNEPPPKPQDVVATPRPEPRPTEPTPSHDADRGPQPQPGDGELTARPHDPAVLAWAKRSISGDKQKDVSKGKRYKINVYKDAGRTTVNRAKVDLDRDDKWDEKYTFDGDQVTLEIAPADDEKYTQTYHWTGSGWLPEGAQPSSAQQAATTTTPPPTTTTNATTASSTAGVDLPARGYDTEVLAWKDRSISGDKIKDASKGRPYKINVYKDAGNATVNRAKVDVNRNDKWDEKYTFEPGKITLQRAPADDERYTETYHWLGNGWAKQK